jgi:hypothetical protein
MHKVRLIIVVVQVGIVKTYVTVVEVVKGKERGMELNLPPKVEKLVWVSVTSFCKISFLVMHLMPLLCQNWPFLALNRLTLQSTLLHLH